MNKWTTRLNNKSCQGGVLIFVLFITALIFTIVTSSFVAVRYQLRMSDRSYNFKSAFAIAEAGIENAMLELNTDSGQWTGWTNTGGVYSLTSTRYDNHEHRTPL